jgi:hypothetical protein
VLALVPGLLKAALSSARSCRCARAGIGRGLIDSRAAATLGGGVKLAALTVLASRTS